MKSNRGTKKATESYVGWHKQTVVDSQPAARAAVSGDPHGEGFDFGHHVAARIQQQLEALGVAFLGGDGNRRNAVLVALVDVAARIQQQLVAHAPRGCSPCMAQLHCSRRALLLSHPHPLFLK
jgi:hypothetical protein